MARPTVAADLTAGCTVASSITTREAAAGPSMVTGPFTAREIVAKTVIAKTVIAKIGIA